MKRGVFMLVLNFFDEREDVEKNKKKFFQKRRKNNNNKIKRYSINVNGKNVLVLELTEKDLVEEDVLALLKIYKGMVLVPEKYKNSERLKEYLYSPKEYYHRALISSLVNQIKSVNKDWKNICIRTESFMAHKELYELVRISKKVTIIGESNLQSEKFTKDCYYEYGAIVSVKKDNSGLKYDVFLNLDEVDNSGKLMINVNTKDFILYPDTRYFESCTEYQKLVAFCLDYNTICSVFSNK